MIRFDHIALGAATLEQGAALIRGRLGAMMGPGGAHPLMGTHNLLSATGADSFLEVIAIDPAAATPGRSRWFGMDDPATRARLAAAPRPLGVVCNTPDLDAALAAAASVGVDLGRPVRITRGDLAWRFALRDDGAVPMEGAAPLLIEWPEGPHPARRMQDAGLRYTRVTLRTGELDRLTRLLSALGAPGGAFAVEPGAPGVAATLTAPDGTSTVLDAAQETLA